MDREPTPARADLEQVVAGLQIQLPAQAIELCELRLFQGSVVPIEERARVHHGLVEEEPEEVVREVVVVRDVAATAGARVAPRDGGDAFTGPPGDASRARLHRVERPDVPSEDPSK